MENKENKNQNKENETLDEDLIQILKENDENINTGETAEENLESTEKEANAGEKILNFAKSKTKKDKYNSEIEEANKKIEDLKATVQRTQADFMNYKRRTEKEKEGISAFANEKIIMEFLGIMDNFERALSAFDDEESSVFKGVEMIKKQMEDALAKNNVEEINTDCKFDHNSHHAVMQDEGESPGEILEVFQKGYKLKDKVIRPAMVKVSK